MFKAREVGNPLATTIIGRKNGGASSAGILWSCIADRYNVTGVYSGAVCCGFVHPDVAALLHVCDAGARKVRQIPINRNFGDLTVMGPRRLRDVAQVVGVLTSSTTFHCSHLICLHLIVLTSLAPHPPPPQMMRWELR